MFYVTMRQQDPLYLKVGIVAKEENSRILEWPLGTKENLYRETYCVFEN